MTPEAGYSGTPLPKKLGIRPGMRARLEGVPAELKPHIAVPGVTLAPRGKDVDYAHIFTDKATHLRGRFAVLQEAIHKEGILWVSWPKKSSGRPTDLDGNIVRDIGLRSGLVDVKVCAVDDVWSGLKFVWRKKDR